MSDQDQLSFYVNKYMEPFLREQGFSLIEHRYTPPHFSLLQYSSGQYKVYFIEERDAVRCEIQKVADDSPRFGLDIVLSFLDGKEYQSNPDLSSDTQIRRISEKLTGNFERIFNEQLLAKQSEELFAFQKKQRMSQLFGEE